MHLILWPMSSYFNVMSIAMFQFLVITRYRCRRSYDLSTQIISALLTTIDKPQSTVSDLGKPELPKQYVEEVLISRLIVW